MPIAANQKATATSETRTGSSGKRPRAVQHSDAATAATAAPTRMSVQGAKRRLSPQLYASAIAAAPP